jgi:hypothetical protein
MDKSTKDQMQYGLAVLLVVGFFVLLGTLVYVTIPASNEKAMDIMLGALEMAFGTVVGYFFGSSKGSSEKTEMLNGSTDKPNP